MYLAKHIHLACMDRRSVVLDLRQDRYIGLNESMTASLLTLLNDTAEETAVVGPQHERFRSALLARGILTHRRDIAPTRGVPRPTQTQWPSRVRPYLPSGSWVGGAVALRLLAETAASLRFRPILGTVQWLRRRHERALEAGESGDLAEAINVFMAARPWFPVEPICRLDAPALCLHLWRRAIDAALVFGVRLEPFAAHCWVQVGDSAILEPFDATLQYTPILVV